MPVKESFKRKGGYDKLKPILEASMSNQKEAKQTLNKLGYTYDKDLSTNESKVFVDKQGNPNIAFRGSKRVKDFLVSDLAILTGLQDLDPRFKEAKALTKKVEEKYNKPVDAFGFSLGGDLASKSGAKGSIITYNKGTGIADIGKIVPPNQLDIRTKADRVSALNLVQRHPYDNLINLNTPLNQTLLEAHDIKNIPANFIV